MKLLAEEVNGLSEQRRKRFQDFSNYSGEFIVFLFVVASLFIVISLLQYRLNLISLILSVIFIFFMTFSDSSHFVIKYISKFADFLRKIGILKIEPIRQAQGKK